MLQLVDVLDVLALAAVAVAVAFFTTFTDQVSLTLRVNPTLQLSLTPRVSCPVFCRLFPATRYDP